MHKYSLYTYNFVYSVRLARVDKPGESFPRVELLPQSEYLILWQLMLTVHAGDKIRLGICPFRSCPPLNTINRLYRNTTMKSIDHFCFRNLFTSTDNVCSSGLTALISPVKLSFFITLMIGLRVY